jgi:hypothetical protein
VAAQVEVEELASTCLRGAGERGLTGHDRQRRGPHLVPWVVEQQLDLRRGHVVVRPDGGEHGGHRDADELVTFAVLARAGLEVPRHPARGLFGPEREQISDEPPGHGCWGLPGLHRSRP